MYRPLCVAIAWLLPLGFAGAQDPFGPRPAVTVMPFEFGTVSAYEVPRARHAVYPGPYSHPDRELALQAMEVVGVGIADLLVERLVESQRFRVFERRELEAVQREQAIQRDEADALDRARYVISGSISFLGHGDQDVTGMLAGIASGALSLNAARVKTSSTTMRVTARVVDTRTGEIIGSATGEGKSDRRIGGSIFAIWSGGMAVGNVTPSNFRESAIGEAADRAAKAVAEHLIAMRAQRLRP